MRIFIFLLLTLTSLNVAFSQKLLSKYEIKRQQFGKDVFYKDKNDNLLNGLCKIADNSGNYEEVNFKNGKKEGKGIDYDYRGQIKEIYNYVDGKAVGEYKEYHHNGEIKNSGEFINDKPEGKWESFYDNGKISRVEYYTDGEKTGKWEAFDKEGKVKTIEHYLNDKATGKWWARRYNSHSRTFIQTTKNYKKGVLFGHSDEKNDDGTLNWERKYKNYNTYTHKDYHPNGKLALIYSKNNSKWDGKRIKYNENGTILSSKLYDYGRLVEHTENKVSVNEKQNNTINNRKTTKAFETEKVNETVKVSQTESKSVSRRVSDFNYKALLISNENYLHDIVNLDFPTTDAKNLIKVLANNYNFQQKNIVHLKYATRSDIINTLDSLASSITSNDNLLIFYAGHGVYDETLKKGYWVPVDATVDQKNNWVSNSDIKDYITAINSQHTLLISDACFSGSIFDYKQRELNPEDLVVTEKLLNKKSRKAMTSGLNKTVPDKSIFIKYLIKNLLENKKPYLRAGELYNDIREAVMANTENNPQFEVIKNANHEGGEFVFFKQ